MKHITGLYPRLKVDTAGSAAVGQAGGVLLVETIRTSGLDRGLSTALAPWRRPLATHDPGKIVLDLAVALALGGDCLADVSLLRAEPGVFGRVASDPTVSRLIDTLAADARPRRWRRSRRPALTPGRGCGRWPASTRPITAPTRAPLIIDLDATLVTAHSEKEQAAPTFKRGYGFHPLCAFVDHGPSGTGEPLRPDAAARERRVEHRRRPHRRHPQGRWRSCPDAGRERGRVGRC